MMVANPSSRTQYFSMDDGAEVAGGPDPCLQPVEEASWEREFRELHTSKLQFQQTIRRQQEVEESVSSLLSRLDALPDSRRYSDSGPATPPSPASAEAANSVSRTKLPPRRHSEGMGTATPSAVVEPSDSPALRKLPMDSPRSVLPLTRRQHGEEAASAALSAPVSATAAMASVANVTASPQRVRKLPTLPEPLDCRSPMDHWQMDLGNRDQSPAAAISPGDDNSSQSISPSSFSPRLEKVVASLAQAEHGSSPRDPSGQDTLVPDAAPREVRGHVASIEAAANDYSEYSDELDAAVGAHIETSPQLSLAASALASSNSAGPSAMPTERVDMHRRGTGDMVGDSSLLPRRGGDAECDLWQGWTIETSQDGRLFFFHAASDTSQWQMPEELTPVLGEWVQVVDNDANVSGDDSTPYWRNELLGVSSWTDPRQTTNLFQAALDGNLFFLQLYTEVGGYLDAVDAKGRTALHYNCAGGSKQAVQYLLQKGASADASDQSGATPLHWACRYGHDAIVRILLEAKADPNHQNHFGDKAMHEAVTLGRNNALQWLLVGRADCTVRNRESRTPMDVAVATRNVEAAEILKKNEKRHRRKTHRRARRELSRSEGTSDNAGLAAKGAAPTRQNVCCDSVIDNDADSDEPDPSLALVIVRAARPLLRGVQWLATRVLGERKAIAGDKAGYTYDVHSRQWTLQGSGADSKQHWHVQAAACVSDDSDDSAASQDDSPMLPSRRARSQYAEDILEP